MLRRGQAINIATVGAASKARVAERHSIEKLFYEWHLNTWFVPFDPNTAIHVARLQGFLGGYRSGRRVDA